MDDLFRVHSVHPTGYYIAYIGEEECPVCGQTFRYTAEWAWRAKSKRTCSYRCMKELERAKKTDGRAHNRSGQRHAPIARVEHYPDGSPSPFCGHMPEILQAHENGEPWHRIAKRYGSNSEILKFWVKKYRRWADEHSGDCDADPDGSDIGSAGRGVEV